MDKFRVISDLHLDINERYRLKLKDDVFTVICGDTSGESEVGFKWILKNVKNGIIVNGNHMPYNYSGKTMDEHREELKKRYPIESNLTYLDALINCVSKEVDGILFVGSCMYSDMKISYSKNINGDIVLNKMISRRAMNDYKYGIKEKIYNDEFKEPTIVTITPADYEEWFLNAFRQIDEIITLNEKSSNPLPVVLVTHFPLIKELLENSLYDGVCDNYASYGSDKVDWIISHPSIKCYCSGHAHDIRPEFREYYIDREDGTKCLVVNNARGYVSRGHDFNFNPETYVNTKTWEIEKLPETKSQIARKKKIQNRNLAYLTMFF